MLDSVAVLDTNGDYVSITNYENDGATISSVTTFDWPLEGYQVTRILDAAGDTIQISDADNQLVAMMTLNEMWDDYDDPNDVEESVVYVYDGLTRWGYVDTDHNAQHDSGTETLLDSVAVLDTNGDYVSITNYENDGATISSVTTFDWPLEGYQVTRILDAAGDTIQISDADNQLVAMMTLNEMWDDYDDPNDVEESVVYVYDGLTRWGYVDTDHNAQHDSGTETLLDSVAVLDTNGDYVSITNYENDGATISSVTTFDWPLEGFQVTRVLDAGGDTIQISDADNQLVAMMTLNEMWDDYDDPNDVEKSVVYVYDTQYRWGYVDTDHNAQHDSGTETLLDSVAEFDGNGEYISITNYEADGTTISMVTTFDWPLEGYQVTRVLDAAGDTIQISNADNQMVAIMTLNEMWDDYDDPNDVEESVVYVYDGLVRWGYVDIDKNAQHDSGTETLLDSVAEFDGNGDYVSITNYDDDGTTITSVTTFDWPVEGYQVTRIVNDPAGKDTIQISDADNQLVAMMTLNASWGNYEDPDDVDESTVYTYTQDGDNQMRVGYVDTSKDAVHDATELNLASVMVFDNDGDVISITGYLADGQTMSYIVTYDEPQENWSTQRSINSPFTRDSLTIFDNEGLVRASQTTEGTLLDGPPESDTITESTVYVYDDTVRWGYMDVAKNGLYESENDTVLENKVQYDTNGSVLSATYWSYDEETQTSSLYRVDEYNKEFGVDNDGYVTTTLYNYPGAGDMQIQVSNPDGQLTKKREWDNDSQSWTYIVYSYPLDTERYGFIDLDNDGVGDQLESRAKFDANDNMISNTALFRSGGSYWNQGEIQYITVYNYDGTIATSYNKTPQEGAADGDFVTYQYNREGTLSRIEQYDISANKMTADYYMSGLLILTEIYAITVNGNPPVKTGNVTIGELLETIERNSQVLPDGRTRITNPDTGLVQVYDSEGNLVETTDNQKVVNIYYYDNEGNYVREDNLGYKIVWYGDPTDPETTYTTYYNEMNSITTYSFIVPLGRGNDWRMIQTEYWADGLVIERDYETQDITSISRYERETNGDLVTETIIYQHKVKTISEMNWPESGWRAVLIPGGAENDNDAVMIVDEANKLRGYMEILKSSSYKSTSNIILSVVYDYDTSGNRIGYVDTDKDGIWDEGTETTQYSYTETWSVDDTKEVTRIFDAGGDIIEIRDADFNGKLRARMVLNGTGLSYDYNDPSDVATSNLYLYNADGTWDVYVENSNKNGVYDGDGSETDTGYDGAPNYRSSNGALMQVLDNEGNIISNTFGSGYMVNYVYDNDGTYQGSNETKYYGSTYYYDNEGNPYPEGIIDYHGNYIQVNPTTGSYVKQYKEFETDGTYSGTYNVYNAGLLITQVNSQGELTYKKYTSSGGETVIVNTLTTNADRVDITNASDPSDIDAQILSGIYYEWYDTGTTSLVIDYNSGSGAFLSCVRTTGAYEKQILLNGASVMMYTSGYTSSNTAEEISNGYGIGFMRVSADGGTPQYVYYTQEGTPMVQQIGGGNLSTVDLGTTPTNTVDLTQVYKWTEDGGTTTVYRFNGINRYFSSGVLQKTVWSDSSGNVQRTMNYGAHQGNGFYIVNSIVDAEGLTCTVNRSGSTITGYDLTLASGTDATVDAAGQMTSVSIAGHTQTYDSSGNLTSMTTDDGLVMLSSNGEVSSITDVDGTTMTYHWSTGSLVSFEISDATLGMTRDYEVQSGYLRLSSVTESSGRLTEYYYDTSGSIKTYSDASPSSYSVIVTEGDTTYGYGYRPDGGIPGLYLYYVASPDYTLTYTRHSTYPYYILSQQLIIDGPGTNDVTLEFYGSSWKTGGNYEYGDLYYISGSRFGTE